MFSKVGQKKRKQKNIYIKGGFEVFEMECNYGEAFAPLQGSSNKNATDLWLVGISY